MSEENQPIYTGGPAFPLNWDKQQEFWGFGLSVRDYFAAKAMQGLINKIPSNSELSRTAYEVADAMIAARGVK